MTSTMVCITDLGVGYTTERKHPRTRACSLFTIPIIFSGLFTCMCVCVRVCVYVLSHFSRVRLFETLWVVAHQAPLSTEASILEWVAILSSRGSSQPRN